ncbi:low affinity Fe/Cu permease [Comamonas sp. BIGb0152]|uniref:low affinity iron permease family protein n=1 Tax=Comamonas sp. BIGb0152 TaxID=2940601 RepID=UPI00286E5483|nr:low affinity iron permease family protein [Comamonas sp. BIGb0152]MCS4295777.1 low affinity Fe/Cu permease [Comamonas sp. BIGb0152]
MKTKHSAFNKIARSVAKFSGRPICFVVAAVVILLWALSGPFFHFNDTWQLVINTGTTIVTFLMVFLIQSTQNSDTEAMQIKLDELIRAIEPARNRMLSLEQLDEEELDVLRKEFDILAEKARQEEDDNTAR